MVNNRFDMEIDDATEMEIKHWNNSFLEISRFDT